MHACRMKVTMNSVGEELDGNLCVDSGVPRYLCMSGLPVRLGPASNITTNMGLRAL